MSVNERDLNNLGQDRKQIEREGGMSRRLVLRLGAVGATGLALAATGELGQPYLAQRGLWTPDGVFAAAATEVGDLLFYTEVFPTSPLILSPFSDMLPIPKALAPVPVDEFSRWAKPPGPGDGQQSSLLNARHQIWPSRLGYPDPLVYKIDLLVRSHAFTTSQVLPINSLGKPTVSFDEAGRSVAAGTKRTLPQSTIYGFNGTFPGPRIN